MPSLVEGLIVDSPRLGDVRRDLQAWLHDKEPQLVPHWPHLAPARGD